MKAALTATDVTPLASALSSDDVDLVELAAYCASEIGQRSAPLVPYLSALLGRSSVGAQIDALSAILNSRDASHGESIARIVKLFDPPCTTMSKYAIDFIARASEAQLLSAATFLTPNEKASSHVNNLLWLAGPCAKDVHEVLVRTGSSNWHDRRYAAAAAARLAAHDKRRAFGANPQKFESDYRAIVEASRSSESDIRSFAELVLRLYPLPSS